MIKPWNDDTTWAEIVKLAGNPRTRIAVVAKEARTLFATIERQLSLHNTGAFDYSVTDRCVRFASGARVGLFTLARVVLTHCLRGVQFDVVYVVDGELWSAYEIDLACEELFPLLNRKREGVG